MQSKPSRQNFSRNRKINFVEISEDLQNGEGKFSLPIFIKGLKMHFPRLYSSEVEIGFKLLYYTNLGE